ncbi:MAG TPA: O-antigen ligase family protein [Pirellulales bacterium]
MPAGAFPPQSVGRRAVEYRAPGIAVWSYMAFFLFSFFNVAGLILAVLKLESLPLQPVAFALTGMLVIPMTRAKPSHPYFLVAWVFWIFFALGGFIGPHSLVGVSDMALWQLVLKLWISLIGVPFLTIRAIDRDKLPMLLKTAVVASAIGGVLAVLQVLSPGRFILILTELGRGSGFWLNPNSCAEVLGFCLLLSLIYPFKSKSVNIVLRAIIVIGMLTTFSRTGLAIIVLGSGVYGLLMRQFRVVLQIVVVFAFVAIVGSFIVDQMKATSTKIFESRLTRFGALLQGNVEGDRQADDRFALWGYGWRAVMREPITGQGHRFMDTVVPLGGGFGPHNYYLYVWGNSGILAFLSFLLFLVVLCQMAWRCTDRRARASVLAIATMIAMIAMVDHSFLNNVFFGPIFAIMVAIAYHLKPEKKTGFRPVHQVVRVSLPPRRPGGPASTAG